MQLTREMLENKDTPIDFLSYMLLKEEPTYIKEQILDWIDSKLPEDALQFLDATNAKIGLQQYWDKIPKHYIYNDVTLNQLILTGNCFYKQFKSLTEE